MDFHLIPDNFKSIYEVIGIVLIIGFGIWIRVIWGNRVKRRRNKWIQLAAGHGFQYSCEPNVKLPTLYSDFILFKQGVDKKAFNICLGEEKGYEITAFDYYYTVPSGKDIIAKHHFSVFIFKSQLIFKPIIILNNKMLRELDIFDAISSTISRGEKAYLSGTDVIYFESEEFNRKYYIKCDNKKYAYDIINPRMVQFLSDISDINIEVQDNSVLFYWNKVIPMSAIESYLTIAHDFFEMIPLYIKKESSKPERSYPQS